MDCIMRQVASNCSVDPSPPSLPTRFLDIGTSANKSGIRLIISAGLAAKYLALSYCWGASGNSLKTTKSSLNARLRGIPWDCFPTLFQDTIEICWEIGIWYIWIDALCITQDDLADWEMKAAQMANVYSRSYLTLAATRCVNSSESLFTDRYTGIDRIDDPPLRAPKINPVAVEFRGQMLYLRLARKNAYQIVRFGATRALTRALSREGLLLADSDAPLMTRAWAYQERHLSPRCLHILGEEMVWECNTEVWCEWGMVCPDELALEGDLDQNPVRVASSSTWNRRALLSTNSLDSLTSVSALRSSWCKIVEDFTRLELTKESDRLAALYGIAQRISRPELGRFLAGPWEMDLACGLSWAVEAEFDESARPQSVPFWSWASIPSNQTIMTYGGQRDRMLTFYQSPFFKLLEIEGRGLSQSLFTPSKIPD